MVPKVMNALTVDVEDAINQTMRNYFETDLKPTERVYVNSMRLLDLFSEYEVLATFFILGEVAEQYPVLIREIAKRGHELGIHGYSHARYNTISAKKAREEIFKAKQIVEDVSGVEVIGHRAPEFSINKKTLWVLEILFNAGIKYDSSIFPANAGRYGWPGFNKNINWLLLESGHQIIEAPLSSVNIFGKEIPSCGGGYLRVLPYFITEYLFNKVINQRPANVYIHPYETDTPPYQKFYMDAVCNSSFKTRMRIKAYWYNRSSVLPKLKKLLDTYSFTTMRNVINTNLNTTI